MASLRLYTWSVGIFEVLRNPITNFPPGSIRLNVTEERRLLRIDTRGPISMLIKSIIIKNRLNINLSKLQHILTIPE